MPDLTHMGSRVAVTAAELEAALAEAAGHTDVAAILLTGHVVNGDTGEVLRYVHRLEHEEQWQVNPWRLIERLALRFMPGPEPEDPAPAAAAEPPETADSTGVVSPAAA